MISRSASPTHNCMRQMTKDPNTPGSVLCSTNCVNGPLCAAIPTTLGREQARKAQRLAYKALRGHYVLSSYYVLEMSGWLTL